MVNQNQHNPAGDQLGQTRPSSSGVPVSRTNTPLVPRH